jgi:hypothetical protein
MRDTTKASPVNPFPLNVSFVPHLMKTRLVSLFATAVLTVCAATATAQTETQSTFAAACVVVLGRAPSSAELQRDSNGAPADQISRLQQQLQSDAALQHAVVIQSFHDAFGRAPTDAERAESANSHGSYTELMKRHIQWLADHPEEYEQVMHRAYPLVIHRDVYPEEIAYWKKQGTIPFALLVGAIEDWARRNQPGLMATVGTPTVSVNSEYLTTVRLSPSAAAELRAAAELPVDAAAGQGAKSAHHLIAVGGEKLATGGGIYFVAAGRADLVR